MNSEVTRSEMAESMESTLSTLRGQYPGELSAIQYEVALTDNGTIKREFTAWVGDGGAREYGWGETPERAVEHPGGRVSANRGSRIERLKDEITKANATLEKYRALGFEAAAEPQKEAA